MQADIVLGLQFGDEGKGITTDFLCSRCEPGSAIVVRFSGGQQAGHTVMIDGKKHTHKSYPAGTLRGVDGYISSYCTMDPISIINEYDVLLNKDVKYPKLYIHPLAMMTTPFDIIANKLAVDKEIKDGTCGRGIGRTMKRHLETQYKLFALDILNISILESKLYAIRDFYGERLNLSEGESDQLIKEYLDAVIDLPIELADYSLLSSYRNVIFEGSQGIMLDMDHGTIPNVTFSNTTSRNALAICEEVGIPLSEITTWYATRSYLTRHGNGWMPEKEGPDLILKNNEEEINVTNQFQGNFKIQKLDENLINQALLIDMQYNKSHTKNLVITCVDQVESFEFSIEDSVCNFYEVYHSHSPDSKDFRIHKELVTSTVAR